MEQQWGQIFSEIVFKTLYQKLNNFKYRKFSCENHSCMKLHEIRFQNFLWSHCALEAAGVAWIDIGHKFPLGRWRWSACYHGVPGWTVSAAAANDDHNLDSASQRSRRSRRRRLRRRRPSPPSRGRCRCRRCCRRRRCRRLKKLLDWSPEPLDRKHAWKGKTSYVRTSTAIIYGKITPLCCSCSCCCSSRWSFLHELRLCLQRLWLCTVQAVTTEILLLWHRSDMLFFTPHFWSTAKLRVSNVEWAPLFFSLCVHLQKIGGRIICTQVSIKTFEKLFFENFVWKILWIVIRWSKGFSLDCLNLG